VLSGPQRRERSRRTAFGPSRFWVLAGCSALYLIPTCLVAARRPLWHDEIFTLSLARLRALSDVWSALSTGADLAPPFFYLVTRASTASFGESPLALRLPAVLGTLIMILAVLAFVVRRAGVAGGVVAMLFVLTTHVAHYSHEARPTGLVLGFAGLALLAWQSAADGGRRPLALVGLATSLAAAVATHAYAALLLVPFAAGETARARARGRLDLPVWVALASALTPLVILLPLIGGTRPYLAAFWARPRWGSTIEFYQIAFGPAVAAFIALLIAGAAAAATRPADGRDRSHDGPPPHEALAVTCLAVMPVVAVLVAMTTTGVFAAHYVLWAAIGVAILFGWAARGLLAGSPPTCWALALVLVATFIRGDIQALRDAGSRRIDQAALSAFLEATAAPALPIVIAQPGEFLELAHRAPRALGDRLVYLADLEASRRYLGHDTADRGLLELRRWAPLPVADYATFVAAHRSFQVYVRDGQGWWLMSALPPEGVKLRARQGPHLLFDVQLAPRRSEPG
jgi:hypothetical protein